MENISVKRIDHLGIVAGVIHDLNLIDLIDEKIPGNYKISTGKAVAAMILNGLGFTDRPLSLTPEFFEEISLSRLIGENVTSQDLNRHRLGRCLDDIHEYGTNSFYAEIASVVALKEKINIKTLNCDTSSFSVTGKKYEDTDENEIKITKGFSKDHRPDLPQIIAELVVSPDGGVPLVLCNHSGNTNDNIIFKERCKKLSEGMSHFKGKIIADSKLYTEGNSEYLKKLNFITRIPETIKDVKNLISNCIEKNEWIELKDHYFAQETCITHYDIKQKWIVFYSLESLERASHTIDKNIKKEAEDIKKVLNELKKSKFNCKNDAQALLLKNAARWKFHMLNEYSFKEIEKHSKGGRPAKNTIAEEKYYTLNADFAQNLEKIETHKKSKACFVLGSNDTNIDMNILLEEYKTQGSVERGFRFLKDPIFFTSSFFLKNTGRIDGLLSIMTLALLVYSIAERRIRAALSRSENEFIDPIYGKTRKLTMRRAMQMMFNINEVTNIINGTLKIVITGITELRSKLISMISKYARIIYQT